MTSKKFMEKMQKYGDSNIYTREKEKYESVK